MKERRGSAHPTARAGSGKNKRGNKRSGHSWLWAFVPILALLIPIAAILRDTFN